MSRNHLVLAYLVLAVLVMIGSTAYYYPQLPEQVASHFDASGQPDGWMSKPFYAAFMVGMTLFIAGVFIVMAYLTANIPVRWINLPHKDYWLAGERRAETLAYLKTFSLWMGTATMILMALLNVQCLRYNLGQIPRLEHTWYFLGTYLLAVGYLLVPMLLRFRRPRRV